MKNKIKAMLMIGAAVSQMASAQVYVSNDAPLSPVKFITRENSYWPKYYVQIFPLGYSYSFLLGDVNHNDETGKKQLAQKQDEMINFLKTTTATLRFKDIGRNGKTMRLGINMSNEGFRNITVLQKSYINTDFEASLRNCDNIDLSGTVKEYTLEESIERLHEIDFRSFYTCVLALKPVAQDNFIEVHNRYYESSHFPENENFHLTIFHSGEVVLTPNNKSFNNWKFKPTVEVKPDFMAGQQAEQAAQEFVRLLKAHADVIANAYLDQLSEAEIRNVTQTSLNAKKEKLVRALVKISLNYSQLALLDKLALSHYISEGYAYVAQIEAQAKVLRRADRLNINFDQYLQ